MYRPEELEESPLEFPIQLTEEIMEECEEKLGILDCNVQLVEERAVEGMCTLKFKTAIEAQAAAKLMNGRLFAGLRVSATIYDGSFPLPKKKSSNARSEDPNEQYRLEAFSKFIENGSDSENVDDDPVAAESDDGSDSESSE